MVELKSIGCAELCLLIAYSLKLKAYGLQLNKTKQWEQKTTEAQDLMISD